MSSYGCIYFESWSHTWPLLIQGNSTFLSVLDVHAFERLLGPCMDILKRNIDGYEEQLDKLGISHAELRWNLLCWNFHLESVHRWPIFQQKILLRFSKNCGYHFSCCEVYSCCCPYLQYHFLKQSWAPLKFKCTLTIIVK